MGEVYRAIDINLKRPVAVKVLQPSFTGDPERLARFQREAELLAALSHPNIASIYGLERGDGRTALVMELVEGPTLADRIAQGPLPLDEALAIATQMADALETAHELGIIHRDLKPANIKVRADGTVKVLDFGLAKAMEPVGVAVADATAAPTITTAAMTRIGTILGTAAYMSPEQARGKAVDKRSDIWAFGCVLFEMLTGRRAFEGDDVADVLGAVIQKPVEWNRLPVATPVPVRAVLERCIEKAPRQRIRDMGDVRLALGGAFGTTRSHSGTQSRAAGSFQTSSWTVVATIAAALAGVAAGAGGMWIARAPAAAETVAFDVETPNAGDPTAFAVSPHRRQLVFLQDDGGVQKFWLRPLGATSARVIPGTEGASSPFWSPDSRRIAYFSPDGLEQVDLAGGSRSVIARIRNAITAGGTWNTQDVILFANAGTGVTKGIFQVSASGGEPQPVTTMAPGDNMHGWPEFLPDGRHFLYVRRFSDGRSDLVWRDLESTEERVVRPLESKAWYSPTGHLVSFAAHDLRGRAAVCIGNVAARTVLDEELEEAGVAPVGEHPVKRRAPLRILRVGVGAGSEQGPDRFEPAVLDGVKQRRLAFDELIEPGAVPREQPDRVGVVVVRGGEEAMIRVGSPGQEEFGKRQISPETDGVPERRGPPLSPRQRPAR
jgi:hypothetical protein